MGWQGAVIGAGIPLLAGIYNIYAGSKGMAREDRYLGRGFDAKSWGASYEQKLSGWVLATALTVGGGFAGDAMQDLYKKAGSLRDSWGVHEQDRSGSYRRQEQKCSLWKPEDCSFSGFK